ncbi:MAG: serine protease, partial [Gemmatimonadota bacterium]|nr:serine protease [Gemmatimonadota bacterium]
MERVRGNQLTVALSAAVAITCSAPDAILSQEAASVFERHVPAVVKLEVVEPLSQAPRAVGTAFFVEGYGEGKLLTNYHVVSPVIFDEDKRLRLVLHDGRTTEDVTILSLDAAHDIAVLRTSTPAPRRLSLQLGAPPPPGTRLFSLGHPADLATSVVDGIYNGRVGHSVSPRYHFTGSVNPGMSGGPTMTSEGEVVGINVSTAGNQLSFVIPAVLADALLIEADAYETGTPDELGHRLARRLEIFQRNFFGAFLGGELPEMPLGRATVPIAPPEAFDCGAEPFRGEEQR